MQPCDNWEMRIVRAAAAAAAAAVLLTACGSGQIRTGSVPTTRATTEVAPSTTTAIAATSSSPTVDSAPRPPNCPARRVLPRAMSEAELNQMSTSQGELFDDLDKLRNYLQAHLGDAFDPRFTDTIPTKLEARIAANLAEHEAALRTLVAHPDRLLVTAVDHTPADIARIQTELLAETKAHPTAFSGFSSGVSPGQLGSEAVFFELTPGNESLAAQYLERWGSLAQIEIAGMPYVPKGCGEQAVTPACPPLNNRDPAASGLKLLARPTSSTIRASDNVTGQLVVRNEGGTTFSIATGSSLIGYVVRPGTLEVVGRFAGAMTLPLITYDIAPGTEKSIPFVIGLARCDGQAGSAVPPGTYGLRVPLNSNQFDQDSPPGYLSPEVLITVVS